MDHSCVTDGDEEEDPIPNNLGVPIFIPPPFVSHFRMGKIIMEGVEISTLCSLSPNEPMHGPSP